MHHQQDQTMSEPDISALLCSRICHDLISPVGAIGNGVELMNEIQPYAGDELQLIGQSAASASATLQFYRLAFGAASAGDPYSLAQCQKTIATMFRHERATLEWEPQTGDITRAAARLMCNLMLIASSSLPRAGTVTVKTTLDTTFAVDITAEGPVVNFRPEAKQWLQGGVIEGSPSAHDVHFLTAHRSLKFCGASLRFRNDEHSLQMKVDIPLDR
jgi:histidine phosphotransferase ChpT